MQKEKKSFLVAFITIFILMVFSYALTFIIPSDGIAFHKWLLSPFLTLGSDSGITTAAIIVFLLIIGGITNGLERCGFMEYSLGKIVHKYGKQKRKLLFILVFFLMAMGSLVGTFEEVVPLTPIIVSLATALGFDDLTGMSISLLAVGCGFASGITNPFSIGVAQGIAELPLFQGVLLRIISFVCIYALLMVFVLHHANKVEKESVKKSDSEFVENTKMNKSLFCFILIFSIAIVLMIASTFIKALQDYTLIFTALAFLIGGIVSILKTGTKVRMFLKYFLEGAVEILPSVILILMACSIKYTLDEANIFDTITKYFVSAASNMPKPMVVLFIYLVCLVLEIFVPSGSAKAFLLIPIILPVAKQMMIPIEICILAYAFGDGFSNVLYPTNPALIISLSLTGIEYKRWFRHSIKFQLANLILTSLILLLGLLIY